jgi:ABC-type branched-subunit amino acid transport system substrate-binding protein
MLRPDQQSEKIAVIDDKTAYGEGVAKEFVKGAKGKGAEILVQNTQRINRMISPQF